MAFVKLATVAEFKNLRIKSYKILAKNIAIVKDFDGSFYATEISCKHNNVDLCTGRFKGDIVVCPRHGWTYNIKTGECLTHPSSPLRRHALEIRNGEIYVSTQPDEADEIEDDDFMPEITFRKDSSGES